MSLIAVRKATCSVCGSREQKFYFRVSWNTVFGEPIHEIKSKCSICGSCLSEKDAGEGIYHKALRNIDFV